jgi:acetyltransferase-like isoleucine patch superfamily enzyme
MVTALRHRRPVPAAIAADGTRAQGMVNARQSVMKNDPVARVDGKPAESGAARRPSRSPSGRGWLRVSWAIASLAVVESLLFGISVLPAALFYQWHLTWTIELEWLRVVVLAMAAPPAYLLFAIVFMMSSAAVMRLHGWQSPRDAQLRIVDLEWPLLDWGRYMVSTHLVRLLAGTLLKSTPLWSAYLRLNGARVGRRVFVNSLAVNDHCLLELGDDVVIGDSVHMSGHTVEAGVLKTGGVRLGRGVTVGVGAVVDIGVQVGEGTQIGALSVVTKHSVLDANSTYVGIPARKLVER